MKLAALSRLVGKQNVSFRRPRKTPGGRVIVDTGLPWAPPHELPAAAGDALAFEREGRVWIDAANACDARAARRLLSADAQQARALAAHAQCAAPKAPRAKRDAPGRSGDAYRARRSAAFDAALQRLLVDLTRMEKMWKERGDIPAVIQRQPAMDVRDLLVRIRRASKKMAVGNPESSP